MAKPKKATASNVTVETQLKNLAQENQELKSQRAIDEQEIKDLKRQLNEANLVLERDLKQDLKSRIKGKSNYSEGDLEDLDVKTLQTIDSTLSMGKLSSEATYKSIRTGTAVATDARLTVGNLYGKSRKEILESSGEF